MAVDVKTEIVIQRPLEVVAKYAGDPDNAPAWYANIKSVEWESSPPLRAGSRVAFVAHFLGRRLVYTYSVRELIPLKRLIMSTDEGAFPMETTYEWESTSEGGTRMRLRNRGGPAGYAKLLSPLLSIAMRRANGKDRLLKQILERSKGAESAV